MVRPSSVSDEAEKENEKLQVRRLFKQRYHRLRRARYGVVKDRTRKSKNDNRTLVGKQNKMYE